VTSKEKSRDGVGNTTHLQRNAVESSYDKNSISASTTVAAFSKHSKKKNATTLNNTSSVGSCRMLRSSVAKSKVHSDVIQKHHMIETAGVRNEKKKLKAGEGGDTTISGTEREAFDVDSGCVLLNSKQSGTASTVDNLIEDYAANEESEKTEMQKHRMIETAGVSNERKKWKAGERGDTTISGTEREPFDVDSGCVLLNSKQNGAASTIDNLIEDSAANEESEKTEMQKHRMIETAGESNERKKLKAGERGDTTISGTEREAFDVDSGCVVMNFTAKLSSNQHAKEKHIVSQNLVKKKKRTSWN
jgi:hypothetical protein